MKRSLYAVILAAVLMPALCARGESSEIAQQEILIPARFASLPDAPVERLETLILRPDDGKPHPLALITHGSASSPAQERHMTPFVYWAQALEFARRGWTAAVVMRRGFGRSDGSSADNNMACPHDYVREGRDAAASLEAAIGYFAQMPFVDASRILAIGHSNGGFATVALTAKAPRGLVAVISFAGGRGSLRQGHACDEAALAAAFGTFGKTSRVPMLWIYAQNDTYFGPALARQFRAAFAASGGIVSFVAPPPFGADGHRLFSPGGTPIWTPIVDAFLRAQGLVLRAEPLRLPPPSVPFPSDLGDPGRYAFRAFLADPPNKAFAVAASHSFGWAFARPSLEEARDIALKGCARGGHRDCKIVNLNGLPVP
jgi:dienelactone hydrolase